MDKEENISEKYLNDFIEKLRAFRNERKISAREMSLELGQNVNYINLIENGKRLPSMQGFFLICEYLHIKPADFFCSSTQNNLNRDEIIENYKKLKATEAEHILLLIKDLVNKSC